MTTSCGRLLVAALFFLLVVAVSVVNSFGIVSIQLSATPPIRRLQGRQRRQLNHYNNIVGSTTTIIGGGMKMSSSSSNDQQSTTKFSKKRLFSFEEARKIARGHGFLSQKEFVKYSCPGAYQLPKNANEIYSEEWKGWDDFLGIPLEYKEGRKVARQLQLSCKQQYLELMESKTIDDNDKASRLPYRPDLKYKQEWISWEDWLGTNDSTTSSIKNS